MPNAPACRTAVVGSLPPGASPTAKDAGIRAASAIRAAGGNLAGFLLAELDRAASSVLDHLASDDRS